MKRKIVILSVILIFSTLFIGCSKTHKEGFNEFENKQEVHEELLTKKFMTLKELEKSSDKQQDNEQEF